MCDFKVSFITSPPPSRLFCGSFVTMTDANAVHSPTTVLSYNNTLAFPCQSLDPYTPNPTHP